MNNKLIQQLKEGQISVMNDGYLEDLQEILEEAFPTSMPPSGDMIFYHRDSENHNDWYFNKEITLPMVSVKEFLIEKL